MHAHVILVRRETLLYIPYHVMDASTVSYIDVSVVIDMLLQSLRANDAQDFIVMGDSFCWCCQLHLPSLV